MIASRTPIIRAALRPAAAAQQLPRAGRTFATTQHRSDNTQPKGSGPVGESKGTSGQFNKDGTNPNKQLIWMGLGALGIGALYMQFMARPDAVAATAKQADPEGVARRHQPNTPGQAR
ncbi:hypothetical protein B0H63DRAFT_474813 [Podospora didyma]|uniref:Uncharacterized protein n=1 Tax=Podospora didyma TaxID=330526 RepID=A0AAE0TVH6_9PEZI|nr:hypothetical protein B0H63DRAFT_474813 [Podospora didyma]